jgi:hypothetical protein
VHSELASAPCHCRLLAALQERLAPSRALALSLCLPSPRSRGTRCTSTECRCGDRAPALEAALVSPDELLEAVQEVLGRYQQEGPFFSGWRATLLQECFRLTGALPRQVASPHSLPHKWWVLPWQVSACLELLFPQESSPMSRGDCFELVAVEGDGVEVGSTSGALPWEGAARAAVRKGTGECGEAPPDKCSVLERMASRWPALAVGWTSRGGGDVSPDCLQLSWSWAQCALAFATCDSLQVTLCAGFPLGAEWVHGRLEGVVSGSPPLATKSSLRWDVRLPWHTRQYLSLVARQAAVCLQEMAQLVAGTSESTGVEHAWYRPTQGDVRAQGGARELTPTKTMNARKKVSYRRGFIGGRPSEASPKPTPSPLKALVLEAKPAWEEDRARAGELSVDHAPLVLISFLDRTPLACPADRPWTAAMMTALRVSQVESPWETLTQVLEQCLSGLSTAAVDIAESVGQAKSLQQALSLLARRAKRSPEDAREAEVLERATLTVFADAFSRLVSPVELNSTIAHALAALRRSDPTHEQALDAAMTLGLTVRDTTLDLVQERLRRAAEAAGALVAPSTGRVFSRPRSAVPLASLTAACRAHLVELCTWLLPRCGSAPLGGLPSAAAEELLEALNSTLTLISRRCLGTGLDKDALYSRAVSRLWGMKCDTSSAASLLLAHVETQASMDHPRWRESAYALDSWTVARKVLTQLRAKARRTPGEGSAATALDAVVAPPPTDSPLLTLLASVRDVTHLESLERAAAGLVEQVLVEEALAVVAEAALARHAASSADASAVVSACERLEDMREALERGELTGSALSPPGAVRRSLEVALLVERCVWLVSAEEGAFCLAACTAAARGLLVWSRSKQDVSPNDVSMMMRALVQVLRCLAEARESGGARAVEAGDVVCAALGQMAVLTASASGREPSSPELFSALEAVREWRAMEEPTTGPVEQSITPTQVVGSSLLWVASRVLADDPRLVRGVLWDDGCELLRGVYARLEECLEVSKSEPSWEALLEAAVRQEQAQHNQREGSSPPKRAKMAGDSESDDDDFGSDDDDDDSEREVQDNQVGGGEPEEEEVEMLLDLDTGEIVGEVNKEDDIVLVDEADALRLVQEGHGEIVGGAQPSAQASQFAWDAASGQWVFVG